MEKTHRLLLLACLLAVSFAGAAPRLVPISDATLVTAQGSNPSSFVRAGSQAFFIANDGTHGAEVWRTDGTAAGTHMVRDVTLGTSTFGPWIEGTMGNAVIFTASPNGERVRELWRSDGTTAGTWRVGTIPAPSSGTFDGYGIDVITADTRVFVSVQMSYDGPRSVLVSDGTAGSLRELGPWVIVSQPEAFGKNGKLYFAGYDQVLGTQFMVSDGTAVGTHMVFRGTECPGREVCGPMPRRFFSIGAGIFFTADDGIWKTDGTAAGTVRLASATEPRLLASGNNVAYLNAGDRLWRTDGTAAGTRDLGPYGGRNASLLDDGRLLYFHDDASTEVWRSDGTAAGTGMLLTLPFPFAANVGVAGSRLFLAGDEIGPGVGRELWSLDATSATSELVRDLDPRAGSTGTSSSNPGEGVSIGTRVVFPASDFAGRELWVTDGTSAGTMRIANIAPEEAAGSITGTITDAVTGQPVNGWVSLCNTSRLCRDTARTTADGTFRFLGVTPDTYTLVGRSAVHLPQWYEGQTCPCPNPTPTPVTVSAGYETAGVDFSLARGGSISGRVTRGSNGEGIYTEVRVRSSAWGSFTTFSSAATGEYQVTGLPTGTYTVETVSRTEGFLGAPFIDQIYGGEPCLNAACSGGTPLDVTAGQDLPNINLEVRSYATISGTVRDRSNPTIPVKLGQVAVWLPGARTESASFSIDPSTGAYQSPLLRPGTYHLVAQAADHHRVAYPDKLCTTDPCDLTGSTAVTVGPDGSVTGIDFALPHYLARLSGIVRDSAGLPLANISVAALDQEGRVAGREVETDNQGRYLLPNLPAATYYVRAEDEVHPNRVCSSSPCSVAGATPVTLAAGDSKIVDMRLTSRLLEVSGRVLSGMTGQAVPLDRWPHVRLLDANGALVQYVGEVNSEGRYAFTRLTRATEFYVSAEAGGFHRQVWRNVTSDCETHCAIPAGATRLGAGRHEGIDFALPPFGSISGRVTDALTGDPVPSARVRFRAADGSEGSALTDSSGVYKWHRAAGSYSIYVVPAPYSLTPHQGQVYPGKTCAGECDPSTGTPVTASYGTDVTGIDFAVTPLTGGIRGRVVDDATGAAMANVYIYARSADDSDGARTDAQGYYSITRLAPGAYRLYAEGAKPYYTSVFGGAHCPDFYVCDREGGTAVDVTAANTTANIDFRMIKLRVTSISPAQGPLSGGTRVVVTGTHFTPDATLMIGGKPATILSRSATQLVATTPASAAGPAHVTVTVAPGQAVTLAHGFTYAAVPFTDHVLVPGQTRLRAIHIVELRDAVNALRASAKLAPFPFTDAIVKGTKARALHIAELRTALNQARTALGRPALSYENAMAAGAKIRAADVMELRAGLE
ncbi:MAG TPA: carboxypeptidase regulatory-like domain-containing protein [Thermoanaerobaculia bacterium]|jgi:ELWxxDGT repeat protein